MDEILELVRQIGRQQGQNTYYRSCYFFLKDLQDLIPHVLHRLNNLHRGQCVAGQGVDTAIAIATDLRAAVDSLKMRKYKSTLRWKEFL
ncbi:hypothetical protein ASPFODRAFT_53961 [Aspergillus luchuensis CBS 106.47]|uniref:Uncharacterized protein n=1 Tax=Aspergillus luchuensis (strain CBS 106.47) TaxID=1137211 RepID=A0A1M3T029_ASPLC|nr:hypothetical protein ASPFODRAFT_53961 [Aspergillus luchuensis CBS 106.47]